MTLVSGTRLGPYEVVGQIGVGGMGEVWKARDPKLDRFVAIKILPEGFGADADRLRRFQQEARTLAALSHPNVVQVFEVGEHEGAPYLVMELLEGETLRDRLHGKPIAPKRATEIAREVANGLAAAHGKGILHRDLKPENLFLTKDGRVKVLDFGLAKTHGAASESKVETRTVSTALSESGHVVGTSGYMSPEQVRGESLDARSDLFSLGVVLWEMLTGRRPFTGESSIEVMHAILKDDPPELDPALKVPPTLERILRSCLAKEPDGRFHSAHDLAFSLEGHSESSGTGLPVAGSPPSLASRKYPSLWAWAFAAMLLAAGLAIALMFRPAQVQPRFTRMTFRNGIVGEARFTPDGRAVVYGARWGTNRLETPQKVYQVPVGTLEEQPIGQEDAALLALSRGGELALRLHDGVLARGPLAGGLAPRELMPDVDCADFALDGQLAIVRNKTGRRTLEYPIGTVRAETGGGFSHLRFSPDGKSLAYLEQSRLDDDQGHPCLLDLTTGKSRALTADWAGGTEGLAWKGSEIWFTASESEYSKALYAVSPRGRVRLVLRVPGNLTLRDIAPDGKVLLTREDRLSGVAAGETDGDITLDLRMLNYPVLQDLSNDGRTIVVADVQAGSVDGYKLYLRRTDRSAAIYLGKGWKGALSPDGAWVATLHQKPAPHPVLLPTGRGEPRELPGFGLVSLRNIGWTPDGKLLLSGSEAGQGYRVYLNELGGKGLEAITPEGFISGAGCMSPDGRFLICWAMQVGKLHLLDLQKPGSAPEPLPSWPHGGTPRVNDFPFCGWCEDSRHVFALDRSQIWKVDTVTWRREAWRKLEIKDIPIPDRVEIYLSLDGRRWALRHRHVQSQLFVAEGLK